MFSLIFWQTFLCLTAGPSTAVRVKVECHYQLGRPHSTAMNSSGRAVPNKVLLAGECTGNEAAACPSNQPQGGAAVDHKADVVNQEGPRISILNGHIETRSKLFELK